MRVPVENKGQMPIYVGGVMIPPGETRHFEEDILPPEFRAAAVVEEDEVLVDPLIEILKLSVPLVCNGLAALSSEELARLQLLEIEDKARKGVLEAIAAEGLRRAELLVSGEGGGN